MHTKSRATVNDLYQVPGGRKAEIIDGRVVLMSPASGKHGRASARITSSLMNHEDEVGGGLAFGDNVGFLVNLPRRKSFSPDAAWYEGNAEDIDMDFVDGAPAFAVEVRSKDDYSPQGETAIKQKIRDYFLAGARVVWDVDLLGECIIVYRSTSPDIPSIYRRGDTAEAEPAVPGWRMPVDRLFR